MCRTCSRWAGGVVSDPAHLGYEIPSPAILEKIGTAVRRGGAEDNRILCTRHHQGPNIASPHLGHRRRPSERRAMGIEAADSYTA